MRKLTSKELNEDVMLRQLQAAQAIFQHARHISLAIDGARLEAKDVKFIAIGDYVHDIFRVSWAPLQVLDG